MGGRMTDVPVLPRPLPVPPLALAMIGVMMGCLLDALIKQAPISDGAVIAKELLASLPAKP